MIRTPNTLPMDGDEDGALLNLVVVNQTNLQGESQQLVQRPFSVLIYELRVLREGVQ